MKRTVLKLTIAIFAFTVGVLVTAIWFIKPFPHETLKDIPIIQDETDVDEQYVVYSVLINDMFAKRFSSTHSLNISSQTSSYGENKESLKYLKETSFEHRVGNLKKNYSSVSKETLEDFVLKLEKPIKLENKFSIPVQCNFIDEKQVEKNSGRSATNLVRLSQVGFNKNRTQAFVTIDYLCPLCGFGGSILLEKQNGIWLVKERLNVWVS